MGVLRSEHQATLAELHGHGEELLRRYLAAAQLEALPGALRDTLERIATQRKPLVQALADLERAHDELPSAGNVERAAMAELGDRISRTLGESRALAERLSQADRRWLADLERALTLGWPAEEAAVIERIAAHLRDALRALDAT